MYGGPSASTFVHNHGECDHHQRVFVMCRRVDRGIDPWDKMGSGQNDRSRPFDIRVRISHETMPVFSLRVRLMDRPASPRPAHRRGTCGLEAMRVGMGHPMRLWASPGAGDDRSPWRQRSPYYYRSAHPPGDSTWRFRNNFDLDAFLKSVDLHPELRGMRAVYFDGMRMVELREGPSYCGPGLMTIVLRDRIEDPVLKVAGAAQARDGKLLSELLGFGLNCSAAVLGRVVVAGSAGAARPGP
jgi:hypothetical protein